MALRFYYGNDYNRLLRNHLIEKITSTPLSDPFQKEIILVQNQGMAIWLKQLIAKHNKISCQIEFPFINSFINEVLEHCLETSPDTEYFHPHVMLWKIMDILHNEKDASPELETYLAGDHNQLKRYQLAEKIAHCFDQYQIYRPEVILENLQSLSDYKWQRKIWQQLSRKKTNRSQGFAQLNNLADCAYLKKMERIAIVGIFSMPPLFLEFFEKLAQVIDVDFYLLTPVKPELLESTNNHLIVESLGKAGLDFFDLLKQRDHEAISDYHEKQAQTMLSNLQSGLLNNTPLPPVSESNRRFPSIQIHNCHSRMREVEVLQDNVLQLLEMDLSPSDILVMMPNIADYTHYIKAVFNRRDIAREADPDDIPYTITDNSITFNTPVDEIFLKLLTLNLTKFEATIVLDLLESEAIYKKMNLVEEDIEICRKWIAESNIRWGINGAFREAEFDLLPFEENSWEKGLNRMFLGYCLKDDDFPKLHYKHLPYDQFEGHNNIVLGKLSAFLNRLLATYHALKQAKTAKEWEKFLFQLIDDYFYDFGDYQGDLILLRNKITQFKEETELAGYQGEISPDILQSHFREKLSDEFQTNRYFRGGITISTLQPLRNIPAKAVFILGMNDNDFPRNDHYNAFNLLSQEKRAGDRIKREEDQYLFLEALVSAGNYFIVSYLGQNIRTNDLAEPASPVCTLLEHLKTCYSNDITDIIYKRHKLQAFNSVYFQQDSTYFSFSYQNYKAQSKRNTPKFYSQALPNPPRIKDIYIDDLIRHFRNPAKFFTTEILGARLDSYDRDIKEHENFDLDSLEKYVVRSFIQEQLIKGNSADFIYTILKARDQLPVGLRGREEFQILFDDIQNFLDAPMALFNDAPLKTILSKTEALPIDIPIDEHRLTGQIPGKYHDTIIYVRSIDIKKIKGTDALKSWFYHLIASIKMETPKTCIIMKDKRKNKKALVYPSMSRRKAEEHFRQLIQIYKLAHQQPLPFFPNSAYAYVSGKKKMEAAQKKWQGNNKITGEKDNPYFRLYFDKAISEISGFTAMAEAILSPHAQNSEDDNDDKIKQVNR